MAAAPSPSLARPDAPRFLSAASMQPSLSTSSQDSSFTRFTDSTLSTPATDYGASHSYAEGAPDLDVIPPHKPGDARTLVLCFDGTGDQFDADNSNVVRFFSMLKKDDRRQQMCYYQAGIGTYTIPEIATPFWASVNETLDEMIAWNLDAHVMGGYEFLMQNYSAGDKICIFGFSRGAYTARALAGMVHKVGLLPRDNHQQVPFAYRMYTRNDDLGWKQSNAFKRAFSMDVDIEFIGVWDTVCSVGLIPRTLPFTSSNTSIRTFRHALSLDEHRAKFKANLFNKPTDIEHRLGLGPGAMPKSAQHTGWVRPGGQRPSKPAAQKVRDAKEAEELEDVEHAHDDGSVSFETDVLEVWFAGCHCDVGGGSVPNDARHNLARIPLRWMIRQCFLCNTGIRFHAELLQAVGLAPTALYPVVKPRPPPLSPPTTPHAADYAWVMKHIEEVSGKGAVAAGTDCPTLSEEEEDLIDALCPIYDQLELAKWWWSLEVLPLTQRRQGKDNEWEDYMTVNWGRGRHVPSHKPFYVHRSVKTRMEAKNIAVGGVYKPKATFTIEPEWHD